MQTDNVGEFPERLLMEGGPGDALMKRLRLIRPEFGAASARTAIILAALTWLPLLLFSLIEGLALGGAKIPFLYDIAAQVRFLIAVPILVLAEIPIGRRLREVAKHFLNAGLVRETEQKQFASFVWHLRRRQSLPILPYCQRTTAVSSRKRMYMILSSVRKQSHPTAAARCPYGAMRFMFRPGGLAGPFMPVLTPQEANDKVKLLVDYVKSIQQK